MPPFLTGSAEPVSSRPGYPVPHGAPPRSDLAAAAAAAVVVAQLALAQLTVGFAVLFLIIGRLSRWRPPWLAWPAIAGLGWMVTTGSGRAIAGYGAAGRQLIGCITGPGPVLARLPHLAAVFSGWQHWLPAQLPVALIVAAAEASIAGWLGLPSWRRPAAGRSGAAWRDENSARDGARGAAGLAYRSGALVTARRAYLTASLRRGEVATADGGCVGIVVRTGRRAAISWPEAESGVLLTGQDAAAVTSTGLELATAAIQHRKTVIIIDLASGAGYDAAGILSGWRDVVGSGTRASIEAACAGVQAPLLSFADPGTYYDPLAAAAPARAAALVLAMIDWTGVAPARQSFCADYLRTAITAIAADGPAARPQRPVLDDLAALLRPGALLMRLGHAAATMPGVGELSRRAAELTRQQEADPAAAAAVRAVAAQLAGLRSAAAGTRLGRPRQPGLAVGTQVSLGRALAEREVVLFCLDPRVLGQPAVMVARLAVADLTGILAERAGFGAPADCLVWISGCEVIDQGQLAALLALGPGTRTAVLLSTAAGAAAARLACQVNVLAVRGRSPNGLAVQVAAPAGPPGSPGRVSLETQDSTGLPAHLLAAQRPDALSLRVRSPRPRLVTGCRAVR